MQTNFAGTHVFTSFSYSYLPKAMVLARTLKKFNPDWQLTAVISDRPPSELRSIDLHTYFDHVWHLDELGARLGWIFKHNVIELCTAVKGMALKKLLELGAEKVFYLDPDIAVFHDLSSLSQSLDSCNVLLTPHQLTPDWTDHAIIDNEICSLKHGAFNLGFVGVSNTPVGHSFATWWERRLLGYCFDDIPSGLFTDQKWCDLAPCLFDGVGICKDPGCNVSSWNLSNRTIENASNGRILVNNSPLKFYHFSKLGDLGFTMTTRYAGNSPSVYSLWYWYNNQVKEAERMVSKPDFGLGQYWYFSNFENGHPIPKLARRLYRDRPDLQLTFENPFHQEFYDWYSANASSFV